MSGTPVTSFSYDDAAEYVRPSDRPLPTAVCAAALVGVSFACWAVIIYVVSLI